MRRARLLVVLVLGLPSGAGAQSPTLPAPRLGGYVQLRETALEDAGLTATLNRARFSIDGSLPARFSYRLLVELQAPTGGRTPAGVSLREAIVRWPSGAFAVTAGVFNGEGQNAGANRDSTVLVVGRIVFRPIAQLALGANVARDHPDSLRWGIEAQAEERGLMVRVEYILRHRPFEEDDFGWYVLGGFRVTPQIQVIARQEDLQRPAIEIGRRVRATTLGAVLEIAPNRVRLMIDGVRRMAGAGQRRMDTLIGQIQVRF